MKKLLGLGFLAGALLFGNACNSQEKKEDKSKRESPPAKVTQKITSGATVTIDYSQPSVKGRTIGKDVEPMDGKVWRTGANEATTFETDKELMIGDGKLPAGKYALFTIFNGNDVTVIFNKTWKQWGAFTYKEGDDVLRVKTKVTKASPPAEKLAFTAGSNAISLVWGDKKVEIPVK